jgi:hypothetical protein
MNARGLLGSRSELSNRPTTCCSQFSDAWAGSKEGIEAKGDETGIEEIWRLGLDEK